MNRQLLTIAGILLAMPAAQAFYKDVEVGAIARNRDRARDLGTPIVLMAHQTVHALSGNGPRTIEEHWIWFVADPDDDAARVVASPSIILNQEFEALDIRQCRIFRGADTLRIEEDAWSSVVPAGWPPEGSEPWRAVTASLPPLEAGDVVDVAYQIQNFWSRTLFPSNWVLAPLTVPEAPTIERHVMITYPSALKAWAKVVDHEARLRRHHGASQPMIELLTGNLPAGPSNAGGLDAPRLLFTSNPDWGDMRGALDFHLRSALIRGERLLADLGDSLAAAHGTSRQRLSALLEQLDRYARIPRHLTASTYYPRPASFLKQAKTADRQERAYLAAALAAAAHMRCQVFLARESSDHFHPGIALPMQFDRVVLRVLLAEEDRYLVIDPWMSDLESAAEAVPEGMLLCSLNPDDDPGLYRLGELGSIEAIDF